MVLILVYFVFRNYYDSPEQMSTKKKHVKIEKWAKRIKTKLEPASSYLSIFADSYYVNRAKHPTF